MSIGGVSVPGDHGRPLGEVHLRRQAGSRWPLRPGKLLGSGLALVAMLMMVSIIGIFVLLEHELTRDSDGTIRNSPFSTFQLYGESLRTTEAISDVLARPTPPTEEDLARIRERFDIFYSRIGIYRESLYALKMPDARDLDSPISLFAAEAEDLAKLLDGITDAAGARATLRELRDRIAKRSPVFASILAHVHQLDTSRRLEAREAVKHLYRLLATASAGLAVSLLGLLVVLVHQMRSAARTQARVEANELENLSNSLALMPRRQDRGHRRPLHGHDAGRRAGPRGQRACERVLRPRRGPRLVRRPDRRRHVASSARHGDEDGRDQPHCQ